MSTTPAGRVLETLAKKRIPQVFSLLFLGFREVVSSLLKPLLTVGFWFASVRRSSDEDAFSAPLQSHITVLYCIDPNRVKTISKRDLLIPECHTPDGSRDTSYLATQITRVF